MGCTGGCDRIDFTELWLPPSCIIVPSRFDDVEETIGVEDALGVGEMSWNGVGVVVIGMSSSTGGEVALAEFANRKGNTR